MASVYDMRRITYEDGRYRFGPVDSGHLCPNCGFRDQCSAWREVNSVSETFDLGIRVRTCGDFIPVIPFVPPLIGLGDSFNTFRLGKAWSERVQIGSTVALCNARSDEIFGTATVKSIDCGDLDDMLNRHAGLNHMMLETSISDAPEALRKVLYRSYGKNWTNDGRAISVIYLERRTDGGAAKTAA